MFLLFIFLITQINNSLIGKWEQITSENKGLKDVLEFKEDSVIFIQEFFSENFYEIENENLKIINNKNEKVIESKFYIVDDSLFLLKGNRKDKMIRISSAEKNNILKGTWTGKTDKGITTYFSFKNDKQVFYKAVIDQRKFKYKKNYESLIVFTGDNPAKINFKIKENNLILIYTDTNEKFEYKKIN